MIDQDPEGHPLTRLVQIAIAGGGTAGLLHGLTDRALTALIGALTAVIGGLVLEYFRPTIRRRGELRAERVVGPRPPPSPPPSAD